MATVDVDMIAHLPEPERKRIYGAVLRTPPRGNYITFEWSAKILVDTLTQNGPRKTSTAYV
jgi:hypothetical protein